MIRRMVAVTVTLMALVVVVGCATPPRAGGVVTVELDASELTIAVGATATVTATVAGAPASNAGVVWTSDEPDVMSVVDAGGPPATALVRGVSPGSARLRATSDHDQRATAEITVTVHDVRTLAVQVSGAGTGTVLAPELGLSCRGDCAWLVPSGTPLWLDALPDAGSDALPWAGCAVVVDGRCGVGADGDAVVAVSFEPETGTGALDLTFVGMPSPWSDLGYARVSLGSDEQRVLFASGRVQALTEGRHTVEALPLDVCGVSYLPDRSTFQVDVERDGVSAATVRYAPTGVERSSYRARLIGVNSNREATVDVDATVLLEDHAARIVGCVTVYLNGPAEAHVTRVELRQGNAKNHFLDPGPLLGTLAHTPGTCVATATEATCLAHIDDDAPRPAAVAEAVRDGELYLVVRSTTPTLEEVVVQVAGAAGTPAGDAGGTLRIVISSASIPAELIGAFHLCVTGFFAPHVIEREVCDITTSTELRDLYGGLYTVSVHPTGFEDVSGLRLLGNPAVVYAGADQPSLVVVRGAGAASSGIDTSAGHEHVEPR